MGEKTIDGIYEFKKKIVKKFLIIYFYLRCSIG